MSLMDKAIWYIESHYREPVSLEEVAEHCHVSHYHLTRAFATATGYSLMRFVRARRLSEAARQLTNGATDILALAIDSGYNSHEAFTRAFREQFGVTPEAVRAQGHTNNVDLVEPMRMKPTLLENMQPPRYETRPTFLVAGLGEHYASPAHAAIPSLWQKFGPYLGHIAGQKDKTAYGVIYNADSTGNFDYIASVEVSDFNQLPPEFTRFRVPEQKYAVFALQDHISAIHSAWGTVWNKWIPELKLQPSGGAELELYPASFDPRTGLGGYELWVAINDFPR